MLGVLAKLGTAESTPSPLLPEEKIIVHVPQKLDNVESLILESSAMWTRKPATSGDKAFPIERSSKNS